MAIKIYSQVDLDKVDEFKQKMVGIKADKSLEEKVKALSEVVESQSDLLQEIILSSYEKD